MDAQCRARIAAAAVSIAVAALGLTGCKPPRAVLTVDHAGSSADAEPGDGLCADSEGHCTLRAALEEADGLGPTEIRVPAGPVGAPEPLYVRSDVVVRPVGERAVVEGGFVVTQGGRLDVAGLRPPSTGSLSIAARDVVRIEDVHLDVLQVHADGHVVGHRVTLLGSDDGAPGGFVASRGELLLTYSTVRSPSRTGAAGSIVLAASLFEGPCYGPLTSAGHNVGPAACGLSDQTDVDAVPSLAGVVPDAGDARYALAPDSVVRDLIPEGTAGCGTGAGWPGLVAVDDDGDGSAGCEAGPLQLTGTAEDG